MLHIRALHSKKHGIQLHSNAIYYSMCLFFHAQLSCLPIASEIINKKSAANAKWQQPKRICTIKTFTAFCVMSKFMSIATFKMEFPHRPECKIPAIKVYMDVHQGNWYPIFFFHPTMFYLILSIQIAMREQKKRIQLNCCKCNIRGAHWLSCVNHCKNKEAQIQKFTCYSGANIWNAHRRPKWWKKHATLIFIFIMCTLHSVRCISIASSVGCVCAVFVANVCVQCS